MFNLGPDPSTLILRCLSTVLIGALSFAVQASSSGQFVSSWGAVALSKLKSDAIGMSSNQATKDAASQEAISNCQKAFRTTCYAAEKFHNKCMGIASTVYGEKKFYFASSTYQPENRAQLRKSVAKKALQTCSEKSSGKCIELNAYCSSYIYQLDD
jgi:hypothetical protein